MKTAICPGSFDPVTLGHIDIIERAAAIFEKTVVVVMQNSGKRYAFSTEERVEMLRRVTAAFPGVTVEWSDRLLADFCADRGDVVIVKGLRAVSDFEHEFQMALINRHINPKLDTVFLTASEKYQYLSSSVVKEVCSYGGDVSDFIPPEVHADIMRRFQKQGGR